MRGTFVGLLAAALMTLCGVASANIIYNIDISGGGETVMGTITTDGTLGALTVASIAAWNLNAAGPIVLTVASPGNFLCQTSPDGGCGVTAEADGTLVQTGGGTGAFIAFYGGVLGDPPLIAFFTTDAEVLLTADPPIVALIPTGQGTVLGTAASAPEPPTAILLGLGLACLGLACTRARRRRSAAV